MDLFSKIKSQLDLLKRQEKQLEKLQSRVDSCTKQVQRLQGQVSQIQLALGRIESRQLQSLNSHKAAANEFQVFSQWGEDGIIQFLLRHIPIRNKIFVEFGVQNYVESNTRFLLINNNWSGLILDSSEKNIDYIQKDSIYWKYNLKAVQAFITKDNINDLLSQNSVTGEIGLLSIDIDGNDYWVWEAIHVVTPAIVIIEYNFRFGKEKAVTIPYDEQFVRSEAHYSMIYFGASLKALCQLADRKGYDFVGSNTAGNNAFFVRKDLRPEVIRSLTPEEGYVIGQFREARDRNGNLCYLSLPEEEAILASLPLIEVG
jgi:prefoldin subunit 5